MPLPVFLFIHEWWRNGSMEQLHLSPALASSVDPSLRPLFKGDMAEQGRKLMTMIGTAVANLHQLHMIVPAVQDLGHRHARYGVAPSHYQTVATALLWTLEQGLGDEFTPETRDAWVECYSTLASTVQNAGGRTVLKANTRTHPPLCPEGRQHRGRFGTPCC
jgi:hemoglobin-like flavoprotein